MSRITAIILLLMLFSCNRGRGPVLAEESLQQTGELKNMPVDNTINDETGETISIEELYAGRENYEGRVISVKGKVVKVNPAIMGVNWVHIQDGTSHEGKNDLTITTAQEFIIGTEVTVTGKIILDKDFGYGYFYEVLMENGERTR